MPPTFAPEIWNTYNQVLAGHRTTKELPIVIHTEPRPRMQSDSPYGLVNSIVCSRNMFAFSSDERAFNIESYFRTDSNTRVSNPTTNMQYDNLKANVGRALADCDVNSVGRERKKDNFYSTNGRCLIPRLSWGDRTFQTAQLQDKRGTKRTFLLRRFINCYGYLASERNEGVRWGADRIVLLRLYRSLIRSKLDYGCFIYGLANKSKLRFLDTIHHHGIRLATGAFRTSRIASLYCEAGNHHCIGGVMSCCAHMRLNSARSLSTILSTPSIIRLFTADTVKIHGDLVQQVCDSVNCSLSSTSIYHPFAH
ncbi:hypothetical protein ANN_15432 [Periplaneta americana]|uniref:Uncharacterized protein n=1 Tax=Periplaneta americana TaxID=6978 RepID=A0ABQ8SHB8_PERAM|nr:hypothetical protein ANN_15432 [Periplaneta americana]